MNINKFTQSSMAAVQNLEKIAADYGNQEIEQEHLLYSLLTIDDSLILKLIEKMGITKDDDEPCGRAFTEASEGTGRSDVYWSESE